MKKFTKNSKKSALVMLCAALGLTGCLPQGGSNTRTFGPMPAVMGYHALGRETLTTPIGEVLYVGSKLDVGDCVLTQFQVNLDEQTSDDYITPMDVAVSPSPFKQTSAELIKETVPDTTDYTFPITDVLFSVYEYATNYTLKNKLFIQIAHQTFEKQEAEYRLELVKTAEFTYDAYLMAKSNEPTSGVKPADGGVLHVFRFLEEWFPERKETDTEFPHITLNVKYFVGGSGTNVWKSFTDPLKVYQIEW